MMRYILAISCLLLIWSCNKREEENKQPVTTKVNPAANGFNKNASDPQAIAIADSTVAAMGGRKAYDDLRYIAWNFFGARDLVWDKHTGRVRIHVPSKQTTYLININTNEGKVQQGSKEITQPDSLAVSLERAKNIWINDSYWLVMPFKLKDTGVTLKYAREDTTQSGLKTHVLTLTFDNVGATPENKYEVYIDQSDYLVRQWAYFAQANQDSPSAIWPWDNYQTYNGILLSSDRSDGKGPRNIRVFDHLSDEVFESFDNPEL